MKIPDHFWDFMEDGDLNKFAGKERKVGIRSTKQVNRDEAVRLLIERINDPKFPRLILEDMLDDAYADEFVNFKISPTGIPYD